MDYPQGTAVRLREKVYENDTLENAATLTFHVLWPDGTEHTYLFGDPNDITNPSVGVYELPLDTTGYQLGTYIYWGVATTPDAASQPRSFRIIASGASDGDGESGPCEPWITADEVEECCTASETSQDYTEAAAAATQVLHRLVPRYSGTCGPLRVRPCGVSACGQMWPAFWTGDGWAIGTLVDGVIVASEPLPSSSGCGCRPLSRVLLAGTVRDVLEVTIDGDVVDPDAYRVDDRRWLTRIDGDRWPSCQDMTATEDVDGTFSVLYTFGVSPPLPARMAARELACAIFQTCDAGSDDECPLPTGTVQVIRQGITVSVQAFLSWGYDQGSRRWQTGLPLVDMFLNAYNPDGRRKRRARAYSPDIEKPARKLG